MFTLCVSSTSNKHFLPHKTRLNPALFTSMLTNSHSSSSQPLLMHFCISWYVTATCRSVEQSETINKTVTVTLHMSTQSYQRSETPQGTFESNTLSISQSIWEYIRMNKVLFDGHAETHHSLFVFALNDLSICYIYLCL